MYEPKHRGLISRRAFATRLANHVVVAGVVIGVSLAVGTAGYHYLGALPWVDSILNAAMILGGMGPVNELRNPASKLFAAAYALYAGFILLFSVGIIIAPVFHRVLHRFHLERRANNADT
jgi:hypothetical protein